MPTVSFRSFALHYQSKGEGPPLVLVHGSWGDHHNWDRVVPGLAKSFRVISYDRRGHSASGGPPGQGSVLDDAADLAGLIEQLELAPAHIVGTSFGGCVVLRLATLRPHMFRSLIVHEPPLLGLLQADDEVSDLLSEVQRRVASVVTLLEAGDHVGGARHFVEEVALGTGAWDELPEPVRRTFVHNASTWLDEVRDPDALTLPLDKLAGLSAPALITRGDQSPPWFELIARRVARALPAAEEHVFRGAGHAPHLSHPSEWISRVDDFATKAA